MSVKFNTCNSCRITNVSEVTMIAGPPGFPEEYLPVISRTDNTTSVSLMIPGVTYRMTTIHGEDIWITCPAWPYSFTLPLTVQRAFVTPEHTEPLVSAAFTSDNAEEYLYTNSRDINFWVRLYTLGLFTLPSSSLIAIPNPREKFCLILPCAWNMSRKMLKCRSTEFIVESTESLGLERFKESMESALRRLASHYPSTWITPLFIKNTISIIDQQKIDYYIFKLFDCEVLVSISIGFRHKTSFMDFTAATFLREKHSYGKILMFKQGDWLHDHVKIRCWYLGFQLPYMTTLVADDKAARKLTREQFQILWNS
jgi:hypothetical protein